MTQHYGVVRPDGAGPLFAIEDLVEKPSPGQAPSNLAIAGRYLFTPIVFDAIRHTKPDKRGEVQLTDAIRVLRGRGYRILGLKLPPGERRYDIGNFESYFATFLEFALADPVYGPEVKKRLLELLADGSSAVG
jgi:UTP--glucose-1-phosphate uridylyltransferase